VKNKFFLNNLFCLLFIFTAVSCFNTAWAEETAEISFFVYLIEWETDESSDYISKLGDVEKVEMIISGQELDKSKKLTLSGSGKIYYVKYPVELPANKELTFEGQAKNKSGEVIFLASTVATLETNTKSSLSMSIPCVSKQYGNHLPAISIFVTHTWFFAGETIPIHIRVYDDNSLVNYTIDNRDPKCSLSDNNGLINLIDSQAKIDVNLSTYVASIGSQRYSDSIMVNIDDGNGGISVASKSFVMIYPTLYLNAIIIGINENFQLEAEAYHYVSMFEYKRDLTSHIVWGSSNPSIISITPDGIATGISAGSTFITAALGGDIISKEINVIDAIKIDDNVSADNSIQMVFNRKTKKTNLIYTKQSKQNNYKDEIWFCFVEKDIDTVDLKKIDSCRVGGWIDNKIPISIAVNSQTGLPAVAYWNSNSELICARLENNLWEKIKIADDGANCSLEFDPADNNPAIVFYSDYHRKLCYTKQTQYNSKWNLEACDYCSTKYGYLSFHPETDRIYISYNKNVFAFGGDNGLHLVSHSYNGLVDSGNVGHASSIAFDQSGYLHISYFDKGNRDLKHSYWTWLGWKKEIVDSTNGYTTSMAVSDNNEIYICYVTEPTFYYATHRYITTLNNLKLAHYDGDKWTTERLFHSGRYNVSELASLALDDQGRVNIAFIGDNRAWLAVDYHSAD